MGREPEGNAQDMNHPMIFDTSVWIDFLRKKRSPATDLLKRCIEEDDQVLMLPVILQEILQGIRDDKQFEHLRHILIEFQCLYHHPPEAAIGAASLYRKLRQKGVTIRKSNDCLIAWYAITFNRPLVHLDRDFDMISKHSKLKTWKARA
jgi:predicted nucleic acid-binding protein